MPIIYEIDNISVKIKHIFPKSNVENYFVHSNTTTVFSVTSCSNDSHAKLLKLTLDKFDWKLLSWQSVWGQ